MSHKTYLIFIQLFVYVYVYSSYLYAVLFKKRKHHIITLSPAVKTNYNIILEHMIHLIKLAKQAESHIHIKFEEWMKACCDLGFLVHASYKTTLNTLQMVSSMSKMRLLKYSL
jgi:hypothetical protein